jgi:hypothetical protein
MVESKHFSELFEILFNADPTMHFLAGGYVLLCLLCLTGIIVGWLRNN